MCFYFFSPDKKIIVDYYLQEYFLISYFESLINLDIIITNISQDELDSILIISSNNFVKNMKPPKKKAVYEYGSFWCASNELKDESDSFNLIYNSCGNTYSYNKDSNIGKLELFNNKNPEDPIVREGKVCEGALSPWVPHGVPPQEVAFQAHVLYQLNWCILKFTPDKKIPPGGDAFIRLRFKARKHDSQPCEHNFNKYRRLIHWTVLDSLRVNYTVQGPYDICQSFKNSLDLYKNICDNDLLKNAASTVQDQIIRFFDTEDTCTYFTKMLLHIAPMKYKLLHSFLVFGEAQPIGRVPNYYIEYPLAISRFAKYFKSFNSWRRRVYVWVIDLRKEKVEISHDRKLENKDFDGYFQLNYCGFACNYFLRSLKFISSIIVILFASNWVIRTTIQWLPSIDNFIESLNNELFSQYPVAVPIGLYSIYSLLKNGFKFLKNWFSK